jgi:hypothetical protein
MIFIAQTKLVLVPSICDVTRDLKDTNGNYTKSVCTVYQDKIYDDAVSTCTNNGMKIFNANAAVNDNALSSYSNIQWPYGTFWVEGKFGSLFSLVCAASTDSGRTTFARSNISCVGINHFHCEFTGK